MKPQTIELASLIAIFIIAAIAFAMNSLTVAPSKKRPPQNKPIDKKFTLYILRLNDREYVTTNFNIALEFYLAHPGCGIRSKIRSNDIEIPNIEIVNELVPAGRLKNEA